MKNLTKIAFIGLLFLCFFNQKANAQNVEYWLGQNFKFDSVIVRVSAIQVTDSVKSLQDVLGNYLYKSHDTLYLELPTGYRRTARGTFIEIHEYIDKPDPHEQIDYIQWPVSIQGKRVIISNTKIRYWIYIYI